MDEDRDVQLLIQDAQAAASEPMAFKDLKPHERAMVSAIGLVGEQNSMTDTEMVTGIKSVLTYLLSNLNHLNQRRTSI